MPVTYADVFVPYTVSKADWRTRIYMGNYMAILLADSNLILRKYRLNTRVLFQKFLRKTKTLMY
jgi:hypothetical protein